ncbi:MAG: peptidase associated/transthyretin-like domain-containing protein [Planctomycetota bacterium]|jgi:hypothetical protein
MTTLYRTCFMILRSTIYLVLHFWYVALPLVCLAVFLVYRRWTRRTGAFNAPGLRGGDLVSRLAETFVLFAAAGVTLAMAATDEHAGGRLLVLDRLPAEYAALNVYVFLVTGALLLLAVLSALRWRTWSAVVLAAWVLSAYGMVINGPRSDLLRPASGTMRSETPSLTISLRDDTEGAEIWVNGVYLGKSPVTLPPGEFLEKVPYWDEPPADFKTDTVGIPQYSVNNYWTRPCRRWNEVRIPDYVAASETADGGSRSHDLKTYYIRTRIAGEWGVSDGGSGPGSPANGACRTEVRGAAAPSEHGGPGSTSSSRSAPSVWRPFSTRRALLATRSGRAG